MPRQSRLVLPGLPLHVIQRGNNRMRCFEEHSDFLVYLALLKDALQRHRVLLHAYCLMGNHVHLLVAPQSGDGIATFMHRIGQRYAYYFNRKYSRTGTLWEGRFRSCVVQSRGYILECHRYIELNPVRAGLVNDPLAYRWSSHDVTAGFRSDAMIEIHPEIESIGFRAYRGLAAEAMAKDLLAAIREATNGGYPLGAEEFLAALAAAGKKAGKGRAGRPTKAGKSVAVPDLFSGGAAS